MKHLPGWTNWVLRLPLWVAAAALVVALFVAIRRTGILDERNGAVVDAARAFVAGAKPFHGRIAALEARESAALRGASVATLGFAHQLHRSDSLHLAADAAHRQALAAAKTAQDTIGALDRQIGRLEEVNASLRLGADSATEAIDSLNHAIHYADSTRAAAVARADSANRQIQKLLKAGECHVLFVLPCIKHVSVGPSLDVVSVGQDGLVWGPRRLAIAVQLHL